MKIVEQKESSCISFRRNHCEIQNTMVEWCVIDRGKWNSKGKFEYWNEIEGKINSTAERLSTT